MIGRKTLGQVRAELESALSEGPAGEGEVAESLRRFLAAGAGGGGTPNPSLQRTRPAAAASEDAEQSPGGPVR
ncbi:MAG TPA: hypothetical protein VF590_06670 [Isosphaeraceae bacterium]|jgi:hypothetical protein